MLNETHDWRSITHADFTSALEKKDRENNPVAQVTREKDAELAAKDAAAQQLQAEKEEAQRLAQEQDATIQRLKLLLSQQQTPRSAAPDASTASSDSANSHVTTHSPP
jgi:hypothetical protein